MPRKKKAKKSLTRELIINEKLKSRILKRDLVFKYEVPTNVSIKQMLISGWINSPDDYRATLKVRASLNDEVLKESEAIPGSGMSYTSFIYDFEEECKEGTIIIETIGQRFEKGLNIQLKGYELIDG